MTEEITSWIYLNLDLRKCPRMQEAKLFVVEALASQVPEIIDGDLLVVDSLGQPESKDAFEVRQSACVMRQVAGPLIAIAPLVQ